MKLCVLSVNLGGFDFEKQHTPQSVPADYFTYTDENFPPRTRAMTSRLQAKIPKCFGWQLKPGYDRYLWLDGSVVMADKDTIKYFLTNLKGYDIVVFRHLKRPDIRQEFRYTRKGVKQGRLYLHGRYLNEQMADLYSVIWSDKDYVDDTLLLGGMFMYKNTRKVQKALKEWWYYISRYAIQDQLSFAYALRKGGLKIKIIEEDVYKLPYLSFKHHKIRKA